MAKSNAGKWVSRVGAGGGGKAYRKTRPMNYYGAITLIVVLGLLSVVYSRYEYQNPAAEVPPAIGTTWYAALSAEACGVTLPNINPDTTTAGIGLKLVKNNIITVSPQVAEEAGKNATLAKFISEHDGLTFDGSKFTLPDPYGIPDPKQTYKDGDKCPAGSKYAGQTAHLGIAYWTQFGQKKPVITTDPSSVKFSDLMRITFFFEPDGVTPTQAPTSALAYMVQLQQSTGGTGTTTTTVAP